MILYMLYNSSYFQHFYSLVGTLKVMKYKNLNNLVGNNKGGRGGGVNNFLPLKRGAY